MESGRKVWNGDVDMGDESLKKLREEYEERMVVMEIMKSQDATLLSISQSTQRNMIYYEEDLTFLKDGLHQAREIFHKKFNSHGSSEETLNNLNWEIIEFQALVEQNQQLTTEYEELFSHMRPHSNPNSEVLNVCIGNLIPDSFKYLRNLFKKKRSPATHVLVTMLTDEKRNKKPYALPVRYVSYRSIKYQYVRDLNKELKEKMVERGLHVVGTVADGEFCSLRTQGETRPLHLWQLLHDAKESVQKMSKNVLPEMLEVKGINPDGSFQVIIPNSDIPDAIRLQLHNLQTVHNMPLEDALRNIRSSMVPPGYTPYPFRRNTPESIIDMLRSVVATCVFQSTVKYWKDKGIDFSLYLYVPEIDPVTGSTRHDQGDHNHIFRRAGFSIRKGNNSSIDFDAFDAVLMDPKSGLTHAALTSKRKSLVDAERLMSSLVAKSLQSNGFPREAKFVQVLADWHEASDGRGLSQLEQCRKNYNMLNVILDEWMPWHRNNYDLSTIDVNRPVENVCGFSRETVIEITTNIESQEERRRFNGIIGYPMHPRAATTDDLETFFGQVHRYLGNVFLLKDFKQIWPRLVREFKKRMDDNLPFYYWMLNERFSDELPSFDECPEFDENDVDERSHPLRLHRLRLNQREDSSIIVAGRAFLPLRNQTTIRQRMHCPVLGSAPLPP